MTATTFNSIEQGHPKWPQNQASTVSSKYSCEPTVLYIYWEVRRLIRATQTNFKGFNCLLQGTAAAFNGMNWAFSSSKSHAHGVFDTLSPKKATRTWITLLPSKSGAVTTPVYHMRTNPDEFLTDVNLSMTNQTTNRNIVLWPQYVSRVAKYNFKTHLIWAVVNELKLAIRNGVIVADSWTLLMIISYITWSSRQSYRSTTFDSTTTN